MVRNMQNLKLAEKSAFSLQKTEPDYILCMDAQPVVEDPIIAAASSNYEIRLFTWNNLTTLGSIAGHESVVTGVKFGRRNPNLLYTSSWDNTLKCWDVRNGTDKPVQTFVGYTGKFGTFSCCDISSDDATLCVGTNAIEHTNDSFLLFWDARNANDLLKYYEESHSDDVTRVRFHRDSTNHVASASTDGLVCVFDIAEQNEDDALLMTLNAESAVYEMNWYTRTSKNLYCITDINSLHIWDGVEGDDILNLKNEATDESESFVDCFYSESEDKLRLLSTRRDGNALLFDVDFDEKNISKVSSMNGGHNDLVRGLLWNSSNASLVTGAEDSLLCLWKDAESIVDSSPKPASNLKMKTGKISSRKKKADPY
ncbi:WD repeat-containing protein 89-like [Tubulanus polymorphus]|uniref:WD repeat-containing protein 89-like n=1 Tax=Tubulanus polymorphus TaxID=672921 RepID=UPI003DA2421A